LASIFINILLTMEKIVRGYKITYEEDAKDGVDHLAYILSFDEAFSLIKAAKMQGKAAFEDRYGRNFNLVSKLDGSLILEKRREGWF